MVEHNVWRSDGICVVFTAERFQKLAGGKRSATTGTKKRLIFYPERVPEDRRLTSLQDPNLFFCFPVVRLTATTG